MTATARTPAFDGRDLRVPVATAQRRVVERAPVDVAEHEVIGARVSLASTHVSLVGCWAKLCLDGEHLVSALDDEVDLSVAAPGA
jgi:hypothetical protein